MTTAPNQGHNDSADPVRDAERVHRDFQALFATNQATGTDHERNCRAARDLIATAPLADPEDPACWPMYRVLSNDLRSLLTLLRRTTVGNHSPAAFRTRVLRTLHYLFASNQHQVGKTMAGLIRDDWAIALGADDPDTFAAANALARCLLGLGKHAEARALWEDILRRQRGVLGDDHPDVLTTASNLAISLIGLAEPAAARTLLVDTLRRSTSVLGADHRASLRAASNLGSCLFELADYRAAHDMYADALGRSRRVLGADHPDTLWVADGLTECLHKLGEHKAAQALADETRQLRKQVRLREQDAAEAAGSGDSSYYDGIEGGFVVAVVREGRRWRCELLHGAAQRQLADVERELAEAADPGAVVFGLIDVDDEFLIILRTGPAKTRLVLSDATAAIDYEIAADVLRELNCEIPELDLDNLDDVEPWPEGDLDLLADVGLAKRTLAKLFAGDLYADEQVLEIAQRLGFEAELLAALDRYE
jgi:putative tRNA adenosine deaminase-associated protein